MVSTRRSTQTQLNQPAAPVKMAVLPVPPLAGVLSETGYPISRTGPPVSSINKVKGMDAAAATAPALFPRVSKPKNP
jgi:hypothetical protein